MKIKSIMMSVVLLSAVSLFAQEASLIERARDAEKRFFAACEQDLSYAAKWQYLPFDCLNKNPKVLGAYVVIKDLAKSWLGFNALKDIRSFTPYYKRQAEYLFFPEEGYFGDQNFGERLFDDGGASLTASTCCIVISSWLVHYGHSSLKALQQRLITCADFVRVAQEVAEKTGQAPKLVFGSQEDAQEFAQLMDLFSRNTFKGQASVRSNWGAILAAHHLFEKHKDAFKPMVEMVNNFVKTNTI